MVHVAKVVSATTSEMTHSAITLPAPIITAITVFNKIHRIWRWFRLGKIYTNPDNFLKLAAGHGMNFAFGDSLILRVSAVCVLIATRILECVEQHFKLQKSWEDLVSAAKDHYPTPIKVRWEVRSSNSLLSTSTVAWWKLNLKKTLDKVQRITICFFLLCKEAFILSMRITDAIETFSLSPKTRNEGINLLFINGTKWIDRLVDNKKMLIDGLSSNKKVINKILIGIHSPLTADQLIQSAIIALNKTEKFHVKTEQLSSGVGLFLTACVKNWGYEFMYELGLHHLVPRSLVPPSTPPWVTPKYKTIKNRYAPIKLMTKPSMLKKSKVNPDLSQLIKIPVSKNPPAYKPFFGGKQRKPSSSFSSPLILIETSKKAHKSKKKSKPWSLIE